MKGTERGQLVEASDFEGVRLSTQTVTGVALPSLTHVRRPRCPLPLPLSPPSSNPPPSPVRRCAKIIGDIRDQSNCGCCWAFAGAEAASDRMCISTGSSLLLPLSSQHVCFCAGEPFSRGCDGGEIDAPWKFIKHEGAVTGGQYNGTGPFGEGLCSDFSLPHCHHHGPQRNDPFPPEGAKGCPVETSPSCPRTCGASAQSDHAVFAEDKISFSGEIETASGERASESTLLLPSPYPHSLPPRTKTPTPKLPFLIGCYGFPYPYSPSAARPSRATCSLCTDRSRTHTPPLPVCATRFRSCGFYLQSSK